MSRRWIAGWAVGALAVAVVPARPDSRAEMPQIGTIVSSNGFGEFWRNQRASGFWRSTYFSSSKELDPERDFFGGTLQLKALPSVNEQLDGKFEVRLSNTDIGNGGTAQARLLEGYVTWHFARADLRVGKQIVPWGRADGINPTDNLTPRDYTLLLPFEDDQRIGTTAAKLDVFLSQRHTLTLFATPFFEPAKVPVPATAGRVSREEPAHSLTNSHAGVRINKVGEGFDWSVSYFRGFSLSPGARVIEEENAEPSLVLHYDRITVLGADFARNFGRFGFRGEAAYVDTADDSGLDPAVRNPYLHWIVGVDRTFLANLNVNVQFFQRRVRQHRDSSSFAEPAVRNTAVVNSLIGGQLDRVTNGFTFRVGNKWLNDTIEAEILAMGNFTRDDAFVRPLVSYAFNDRWKGTIGAELYRGAADSQFGALKPNRSAFAELRYGF